MYLLMAWETDAVRSSLQILKYYLLPEIYIYIVFYMAGSGRYLGVLSITVAHIIPQA